MSDIQSIRRAFSILKVVSAHEDAGVTLSEVATRVALPKSTVSRMLSTLEVVGAVERVGAREGFRIGDELLALAAGLPFARNLAMAARPQLQILSDATGETLTLCVPDGDCAHYIDQINSPRALQVHDWTGQRVPLHAVSDGKLYLAHRSDAQIERYMRQPMQRFTRSTLAAPATLRRELSAIRKKGYAWTNGEYDADVVGVAAPICDTGGSVVASVCLFGPAFRWPKEAQAGELICLTRETADRISARLAASTSTSVSATKRTS